MDWFKCMVSSYAPKLEQTKFLDRQATKIQRAWRKMRRRPVDAQSESNEFYMYVGYISQQLAQFPNYAKLWWVWYVSRWAFFIARRHGIHNAMIARQYRQVLNWLQFAEDHPMSGKVYVRIKYRLLDVARRLMRFYA